MDRRFYRLDLLSVALSIIFMRIQGAENASKSQKRGDLLLTETSELTTIPSSHLSKTSDQAFVTNNRHPYNKAVTPTYDLTDLKERCPQAICMPNKGHNRTHSKYSCCLPCRCDSICRKIGNCCDRSETEGYMCHLPHITGEWGTITKLLRYFMMDTCLNNSCTITDAAPWGSLYPVYDPSTDVNYINANCAECNGAHSYTYWDLRLESRKEDWSLTHCLSLLTSGDNHGSCALGFTPPKETDIRRHACTRDDIINSCNVTGFWNEYDIELDKGCQRWFSPILDGRGRIVYANIYCALCNGDSAPLCSELPYYKDLAGPLHMILDYRQVKNAIAQPVTTHTEGLKNERCGSFMVKHPTKVMFDSGKTSNSEAFTCHARLLLLLCLLLYIR